MENNIILGYGFLVLCYLILVAWLIFYSEDYEDDTLIDRSDMILEYRGGRLAQVDKKYPGGR